jgi:ABC-type transport system involved in multi-copper enzyme maturation permease subunit
MLRSIAGWLRLAWQVQRWEVLVLIGGCLLLAAAMVIVAWQLDVARDAVAACYADGTGEISAACRATIEWGNLLASAVGILGAATTVAPFGAGIFLGAPLVAREIEHRTAPIAWSLSLSRRRWLAGRTLPVVVIAGVALLALGQASELLLRAAEQGEPGFRRYGMFGPILAARGLAVLGIGAVVGLALGRVLPALLVTMLATVAVVGGMSIGRDALMREESVWRPMGDQAEAVAMVFDSGFRSDESGEIITWDEAFNRYPEVFNDIGDGAPPGMTSVWRIVPPERYADFVVREIGVLAGASLLFGGVAVALVGRRRPE